MKKTFVYCDFCGSELSGLNKFDNNSEAKRVTFKGKVIKTCVDIAIQGPINDATDCCMDCGLKIIERGFDNRPKAK